MLSGLAWRFSPSGWKIVYREDPFRMKLSPDWRRAVLKTHVQLEKMAIGSRWRSILLDDVFYLGQCSFAQLLLSKRRRICGRTLSVLILPLPMGCNRDVWLRTSGGCRSLLASSFSGDTMKDGGRPCA